LVSYCFPLKSIVLSSIGDTEVLVKSYKFLGRAGKNPLFCLAQGPFLIFASKIGDILGPRPVQMQWVQRWWYYGVRIPLLLDTGTIPSPLARQPLDFASGGNRNHCWASEALNYTDCKWHGGQDKISPGSTGLPLKPRKQGGLPPVGEVYGSSGPKGSGDTLFAVYQLNEKTSGQST